MGVGARPDDGSLLSFPSRFPIKVMGLHSDGFQALVEGLVRRHVADLGEDAIRHRLSQNGKYISLTVTITATSQAQLDAIYTDLSRHERVLMAL